MRSTSSRRLGSLLVGLALLLGARAADAGKPVTFAAGSLIIPMDTTYQNSGVIQAYGLVDRLLRANIPVSWCITDTKVVTNAATGQFTSDFTASATDFQSMAAINNFAYRGGPFVIDLANAAAARPIITAFQGTWPNTKVHVATAQFNATEAIKLTVSPSISVLRDGGETIAYGYLNSADIRDSQGNVWSNTSPGAVLTTAAAGPTTTNHQDGALFRASGQPAFCEMMAMHYTPDASAPEVAQEVVSFMQYPVHFNAECLAIGTIEGEPPIGGRARLLTTAGIINPSAVAFPNLSNLAYTSSTLPYAQQDGPLTVEGGVIYAIQLANGSKYYDSDVVMIRQANQAIGNSDVWMTGYAFGACPPSGCGTGQVPRGQVTFLGGHQYDNTQPISNNPSTQGLRLWLNSLFDTACTNAEGQPIITVTKAAPPSVTNGTITYTIGYKNTGYGAALGATLSDKLPVGATFVSASNGGVNNAGTVTWNLGDLAPGASGQVTLTVTLGAPGTYSNTATVTYTVGNNTLTATSPPARTVFGANQPNLAVTASAPATTSSPNVTFTLAYANSGAGTAQNTVVTDTLPPGVTFVSASNGGTFANGVVTWNLGNVAAGGSGNLTVNVTLNAYGTYLNSGAATYGDGVNSFATTSNTTTTVYGATDATIVLTASAPAATAVAPITLTLNYQNTGTSTATNVVVSDVLPPGVTFVSASNGGVNNAGTVTWALGNVAGGASGTLTINVTLNAYGIYKNQGTAAYTGNGAQTATSNTTTTVYGPAQPNIQLTAQAPTLTYSPTVTLTLNYTNAGGAAANNVIIADKLPANAAFVSATNGGVFNAGTVTWNLGSVPAFSSGTVTVTVLLGMPGVYLNNGTVAYTTPTNVAQTGVSNTTSTTYLGGLTLVAGAPAMTVVPQVAFTLTYTNVSGAPLTNLLITDTLPIGATFVSATNGGVFANGTVTWNIGNVPANGTATLTVNLVLPSPGTYTNKGNASFQLANTPFMVTSNTTSTVYVGPNVVVTTMGPATTPDGLVTYTISYVNNGMGTAQGLTLTDILPMGAMFVSATGGGVNNNGTVSWVIGDVPGGGMGSVTVTVRLPQPGTYMNAGSATFTTGGGPQTVTSTPVTTVYQAPALSLTAMAPATTFTPQVTFTISYSNGGLGTATNAVISDVLPMGATFVSATNGGVFANGTVTWNLGTIAPGGSGMVSVTLNLPALGTYMNQGTAAYTAGAQMLNAQSNITTTVYQAALNLTTAGPPTTVVPQVGWTVTYTNVSGAPLSNLVITDALPMGATFTSATGGGTFANGTVTWNVGNVPANGTATFTVNLVLPSPGTYTNRANASFTVAATPATATSNTTTTVYQAPGLQVTINCPPSTNTPTVTCTVSYTNGGNAPAQGVTLKDILPNGAQYVGSTGGGMFAGGAVSWSIGDVAPGASGMVTFTFTFPNAGTFTNQVTSSYTVNGMMVTGQSNVATTVYNPPSVMLVASAPATTPVPRVTFTINYQNNAQGTALGFKISDALPMGATFVSASNGGVFANGVVTWTLGDLAGNASGMVTVTVDLPAPGTYTNQATGTFTVGLMPQMVTSNTTTTVYPPAGVTLVASAPAVTAVPQVTFTINYQNSGMGTAQGLTITDALPPGATFVSATNGGVFANGTVTWNIGDLGNGGSGMVAVTVTLSAPGTYMNTAVGNFTTGAPRTVNSNTTSTLYAKSMVTLSAMAPLVTYVPTVTFSIGYSNGGNSAIDNLVVTDPLPIGATFVSATNGGVFQNGVVTWNVGTVAQGGSGGLSVTLTLPSYGTYPNQASGGYTLANLPQTTQSNTTSTDYLAPGIQVTVSGPGSTVEPVVTWTVSFVNNGKDPASAFSLVDKLPPGVTFVSASNGGVYDPQAGTVTWPLGSVPPGVGGSVTVTVKLGAAGSYPDNASATFTQNNMPLMATSNTVTTVYPPAGLALVAEGPALTAVPQVTWKITYTNTGMATAQQAVISNLLPPGTTFVGASTGGMFANGTVTWNVGDVPAGASGTVSLTVSLPKPGTYTDSATADFMAGMPMTSTSNTVTTIYRTPPLQLTASAPPTTLQPSATFTLAYTNTGVDPISSLVVYDKLLPGETFLSATGGGSESGGVVTWNVGNLGPGSTASVQVTVALATPGTYVNQGTATYTALGTALATQSNVTSTEYLKPGLQVTVSGPSQTSTPTVTYIVTATNTGNATAAGVVLTDPLPAGATFVSASNGGMFANGVVTWNIGDVPPGATYSVTVTVTLPAPGNYTDTAKGDYTVANTPFTAEGNKVTTIYPVPGVVVTASAPDMVYQPLLTIALAYENRGQAVAQGTVLTAPVPAGTVFQSASMGGAASGGTVTWTLGDLKPGDAGQVTFTVALPGVGAYRGEGLATFTAGQQPYAVPSNVTRTVYEIPTLQLVASAPAMTPIPNITLKVDWQNTGSVMETGVVVSDKLPPNVTFVAASNGGVAQSGVVVWNLGNLNPGDKGTLLIDVTLGAPGTYTNSFGGAFTVANVPFQSVSNVTTTVFAPVVMDGGVDAGPLDAGPGPDMAGSCLNGAVKCVNNTPICDQQTGLCRGCKVDAECPVATPFCDVAVGLCRGCRNDSDCGNATSGRVCDDTTKICGPGCRGSGGNGCPVGDVCSSKDQTIGTCGPAPQSDAGVPGLSGGGFGCAVSTQPGAGSGAALALLGLALAALVARRRR